MVRASAAVAIALVAALVVVGVLWVGGDDHDRARVTIESANGNVTLDVAVADTPEERYEGLSGTETIPRDGMLFAYADAGERTYVMRGMTYPLDIVFVAGGRVTAIFTAPVEDPPLTTYSARAEYVIEVPAGWADEHGVSVGDGVSVYFVS